MNETYVKNMATKSSSSSKPQIATPDWTEDEKNVVEKLETLKDMGKLRSY